MFLIQPNDVRFRHHQLELNMATKNPKDLMDSVATSMQQRSGKTLEEWVKAVEPSSKTKVTLGLRFKTAPTSPLLEEGKAPGQCTHRIVFTHAEQISPEIAALIKAAYDQN